VADLGHRLVGVEERLEDLAELGVIAQILRGATARDHQSGVLARIDLREAEIRRPGVARLLGVRVEARLEVVYDEPQPLAGGGRDMNLVALLPQPLVRVENLEGLGGVAGDDQDLRCHDCSRCRAVDGAPADGAVPSADGDHVVTVNTHHRWLLAKRACVAVQTVKLQALLLYTYSS
jgi:hypothetical protein